MLMTVESVQTFSKGLLAALMKSCSLYEIPLKLRQLGPNVVQLRFCTYSMFYSAKGYCVTSQYISK